MSCYGSHVAEYLDAGLPVFPVNTGAKRPAVKGWQGATPGKFRAWASNPRLAACDGIGLVMGRPSGIVEIDVDAPGEAWAAYAVERFGETPITILTASGKRKLWFRHSGEGRRIRPFGDGVPLDALGGGFTIAPPSERADLGTAYRFATGGLDDVGKLPTLRPGSLDSGPRQAAEAVRTGERNDRLWRWCMGQARHCDDAEALIDAATTWASAFPEKLPLVEVRKAALSAWGYEATGRNYLGLKRPQVTERDRIMDALMDAPDAYLLLSIFQRYHRNKPWFAIAPRAMSAAGDPPWRYERIERARDVLLERGLVVEIAPPRRGLPERGGSPGRYKLTFA